VSTHYEGVYHWPMSATPTYDGCVALMGYMYFPHRLPVIEFRLAENIALDYSDFRDEGLRVAVFTRSGGGKSNLAALFAEQVLEQGLRTLVIKPLREYNTRSCMMSCGLPRVATCRWLPQTRNPILGSLRGVRTWSLPLR